jgi:BlaI family penicillinase repressor
MVGSRPDPLTPAEWKVMKIVWEKKSCAARDVYTVASTEHDWTPSTTKTFLRRLTEKGYLKTTRVGNSFLYRPARTATKSLLRAADTLLENALEGTVAPLLVHMVKQGNLSADELAELRSLLDELPPTEEEK